MAIEINGHTTSGAQTTREGSNVQVGKTESNASQQETGRSSSQDTVSLTDTANQLNKLEKVITDVPVVDLKRVEAIQKAISEGTYKIDSNKLADLIINHEKTFTR